MKTNNTLLLYTLFLFASAVTLISCSKENENNTVNEDNQIWKVSIKASPADQTRAISVGGNDGRTLYFNWDDGDAVEVLKSGASVGSLTADKSAGNTAFATLDGTLTGTFSVNDEVKLYYHTATLDYTGQVGTLAGVSTDKSYLEATSTVKSVDGSGGFLAMTDAAFRPMQAYLDLTFTDGSSRPLNISSLEIWAEGGKLVKTKAIDGTTTYATEAEPLIVTPASATNKFFLALRDENGAANKYHFKATVGGYTFTYEGNKNLEYGHFYGGDVAMAISGVKSMPLTIEAKVDDVDVRFDSEKTIEYSIDGGATWTPYKKSGLFFEVMVTLDKAGDKVMLRGENDTYDGSNIILWEDCYVYGNIMSLISPTGYASLTTLTGDSTFEGLFSGSKVYSHPVVPLILPATTLTESCYLNMFQSTNITTAPDLPATALAANCYEGMFSGCKSLATAPELPATTLAKSCYQEMFYGCESLTTTPDLAATNLAESCYEDMFNVCLNLTTAPSILPATTLAPRCYSAMFYGCKELTSAPILPAESLTSFCYSVMFNGCTKLTSIVCLAKDKLDEPDWSFYEWTGFVTTGTLYINPDLVLDAPATFPSALPYPWDWTRNDDYLTGDEFGVVPHGWTVQKYVPAIP